MEEKNASKNYPPELLELFREFQYGRIGRRSFLDRAGKFAIGSTGAAAMLETVAPSAGAQQVPTSSSKLRTRSL